LRWRIRRRFRPILDIAFRGGRGVIAAGDLERSCSTPGGLTSNAATASPLLSQATLRTTFAPAFCAEAYLGGDASASGHISPPKHRLYSTFFRWQTRLVSLEPAGGVDSRLASPSTGTRRCADPSLSLSTGPSAAAPLKPAPALVFATPNGPNRQPLSCIAKPSTSVRVCYPRLVGWYSTW